MNQYDFLVINDVLEECVKEVHAIIQSQHFCTNRNKNKIKDMQNQLLIFAKGE